MSQSPSIVWLRNDLRLGDNPALHAAINRGEALVLVYIHDEVSPEVRPPGGATKWWLHHSLQALASSVKALGGELILRSGAAEAALQHLVEQTGAGAVYWNRRYGRPREIDQRLKESLRGKGVTVESFGGNLLFEPWSVTTGEGKPFRVFTPFWRACLASEPPREPLPAPTSLSSPGGVTSESLDSWDLLPTSPDWSGGFEQAWMPGESGAWARLEDFLETTLSHYHRRDEPAPKTTSRLSPHLRFGEISPHSIWHALEGELPQGALANKAKFLSEIGWREFSYNILFHQPDLHTQNFRPEFDAFPWGETDPDTLRAWQRGTTGVALVDAGMRELWATGYMHNRVRMVAASFLIKNLLVDWRVGEAWFWDTLVDADDANNPASWQWVAGSGADAAPYFRVFNPLLQAEKFDPDSEYIKRWVPEWGTAAYPSEPIIDLKASRDRALAAFQDLKGAPASPSPG
jgi:deoxyribodipyrimidine photo-lyase